LYGVLSKRIHDMIYTYGCSFTKWRWSTWSDWLEKYTRQPVTNFAWPGNFNQMMLYQILSTDITKDDTVYIMITHPNRTAHWYDEDFIEKHYIKGQIPESATGLPVANTQNFGFYRHVPDQDPSLTEMYINNWHIIYQIQKVLDSTGCDYKMMLHQNPWHDSRPILKPKWECTWFNKPNTLSKKDYKIAKSIMAIPAIKKLLSLIDWSKFNFEDFDVNDPNSFYGLQDYQLERMDLLEYQHSVDRHPAPIVAHDYLTKHILGIEPDLSIQASALDESRSSLEFVGEPLDFNSLIPPNNDYTTRLLPEMVKN